MRTNFKLVVLIVLLGVLLAYAGDSPCQARAVHRILTNDTKQHPIRVSFHCLSSDYPARHPFAPCSKVAIPPDEDDDEDGHARFEMHATRQTLTAPWIDSLALQIVRFTPRFPRRPDQPLYQTLCILLI